jgi:hypothetical protein
VSDSAGVTIIQNFGGMWTRGNAWQVAAEPSLAIGRATADSNYRLSRVIGATRLDDGTIVLADGGTQELRWFNRDGGFVRSVGGNTVFASLEWIGRLGSNSVIVFDFGNLQLSVYGAAGEPLQTGTLVVTFQASPSSVKGVFGDSSVLAVRDVRSWAPTMIRSGATPEGLVRGPTAAFRYHTSGTFLSSAGTFRGAQRIFSKGQSRFVRVTPPPFGRTTVFAVSEDHFFVGTQDEYELRAYDMDGQLATIVRLERENTPTTQADIDRYKRARLAGVHELQRPDREMELDALPYPETMPAFGPIEVDAAGNLWVASARPFGDERSVWTVFDTQHRMLGTVEIPRDLTVHEIGHDYVLGSVVGEDAVDRVQLHRLDKPGG